MLNNQQPTIHSNSDKVGRAENDYCKFIQISPKKWQWLVHFLKSCPKIVSWWYSVS